MKTTELKKLEMDLNNRFIHSENVSEDDLIAALREHIEPGIIGSIQVREYDVTISSSGFSVRKLPFHVIADTLDGYILIARFASLNDALNYCINETDGLEPFDGQDLSHNDHIRFIVFDKNVYIDEDSCDPVVPKPVYETGMYYTSH